VTLSYRVDLKPTLEKFVLQRGEGGQQGDVIDLEWRSIVVKDSVIVNAPQYGNIDINRLIDSNCIPIWILESCTKLSIRRME
jgi:hypothetical protein